MGMVGSLFGNIHEKPGNIAGLAIAVSLVLLLVVFFVSYFWPNTNNVPVGELTTLFGGIITLALGYLFGKSSKD